MRGQDFEKKWKLQCFRLLYTCVFWLIIVRFKHGVIHSIRKCIIIYYFFILKNEWLLLIQIVVAVVVGGGGSGGGGGWLTVNISKFIRRFVSLQVSVYENSWDYAGHFVRRRSVLRRTLSSHAGHIKKNRKIKNKTCIRTLLYIPSISYTMDNMTLTYMNKCIYFFPKYTRNLARFLQLVL